MAWFKLVAPLGRALGLIPLVKVITVENLEESLTAAGFVIDHKWRPGTAEPLFSWPARRPSIELSWGDRLACHRGD